MNTFYQMQQVMEAKKLEMEMHFKESSYSYHLKHNKEKLSTLSLVKRMFNFKSENNQIEPCCVTP